MFYRKENKFESEIRIIEYKKEKVMLIFTTENEIMYGFVNKNKFYNFTIKVNEHGLLGFYENEIYSGTERFAIDELFINFQKEVLLNKNPTVKDEFRQKAIVFYENVGLLDKALEITTNENQKFEIYLKLNNLEKAYEIAKTPAKFKKLGEKYVEIYKETKNKDMLEKASECFYNSGDLTNLFYTDVLSGKKYLKYVANKAKLGGQLNLALLSSFIDKEYEVCDKLLENTKFSKLFKENYINK